MDINHEEKNTGRNEKKARRAAAAFAATALGILLVCAGLIAAVDPYHHFHPPLPGLAYGSPAWVYTADGIIRNYDYDALIIGTSLSEKYRTEQVDRLFGVQSIRTSCLGEGFRIIGENVRKAVQTHPDMKLVIWSLDPMFFTADPNYKEYEDYPEYLYDSNPWNDVNYCLNGSVLLTEVFPVLASTWRGGDAVTFDSQIAVNEQGSREELLFRFEREPVQNLHPTAEETAEVMANMEKSIRANILSVVEESPDVQFIFIIPPYSILYWDQSMRIGEDILNRRINMEREAARMLLEADNVSLYAFDLIPGLIENLDQYNDSVHFTAPVSSMILGRIAAGENRLTPETLDAYYEELRNFLLPYPYDDLFQ